MFHSLWPPSLCFSEWQRGREQWWCSIGESEHATDWHLSGELRRQARLLLWPDKDGRDGRKSHESWGEKQQNKVGRVEEDRRFVRCARAPYCGLRRLCQMRMGNREAEFQPFLMFYLLVTICHLFFSCLSISAGRNSLHFFRENPVWSNVNPSYLLYETKARGQGKFLRLPAAQIFFLFFLHKKHVFAHFILPSTHELPTPQCWSFLCSVCLLALWPWIEHWNADKTQQQNENFSSSFQLLWVSCCCNWKLVPTLNSSWLHFCSLKLMRNNRGTRFKEL